MRSLNVALRQELDLYACLRPVRYFEGVPSPVKHPEHVNMVIFRENTEDIYAGVEWKAGTPEAQKLMAFLREELGVKRIRFPNTSAFGIKPISEEGTKRLVRAALQYAVHYKLPSVTLVHKGNIMKFTEGAFRDWGYALAKEEFGAVEIDGGPWCRLPNGTIIKDVDRGRISATDPHASQGIQRDRDAEPERRLHLGCAWPRRWAASASRQAPTSTTSPGTLCSRRRTAPRPNTPTRIA